MDHEVLDRYRGDLRVGLLHAVRGDSEAHHAARVVLGLETPGGALVDGMVPSLRAGLLLFVAEELGAHLSAALPAAVALELIRTASDLHAGIVEKTAASSDRSGGRSSLGVTVAVQAGDLMFAAALEAALRTSQDILHCLLDAWRDTLDGKALWQSFGARWGALSEVRAAIQLETAATFRCAFELGGIVAGASAETLRRLASFGEGVGMAWALRDGLVSVWGDPDDPRRPRAAALRAQAKSYPLVAAYDAGTESDRRTLERAIKGAPGDAEFEKVFAILDRLAVRAETEDRVREHLEEAAAHVPYVPFSERGLQTLTELFDRLKSFAPSVDP